MTTYSDKLKSPKWQKKRLEILQRDDFTCKICGDKDTTLNIHHLKYLLNPWDVDNKYLVTVCEHCHKIIESYKNEIDDFNSLTIIKKLLPNDKYISIVVFIFFDNSIYLDAYNNDHIQVIGLKFGSYISKYLVDLLIKHMPIL